MVTQILDRVLFLGQLAASLKEALIFVSFPVDF